MAFTGIVAERGCPGTCRESRKAGCRLGIHGQEQRYRPGLADGSPVQNSNCPLYRLHSGANSIKIDLDIQPDERAQKFAALVPFVFWRNIMTLREFFEEHTKAAIAFSGGVDSAYLFYAALKWGKDIRAYYVKSAFQPEFELEDAKKLAEQLHGQMRILPVDVLCESAVTANGPDRCYHCKKQIFSRILEEARQDGFCLILDGTNASDDANDRPGMRALQEMGVRSPLRECGLTKSEIRRLSRLAGLFTWEKPAYACLATRIPTGELITEEKLRRTQWAERYLAELGLRDFRVRLRGNSAKLQLRQADLETVISNRKVIVEKLKQHYCAVLLDLEARDEQ